MSRALIALIAMAVTYGGLAFWGYREHEIRLRAQSELAAAQAQLQVCRLASDHQNAAVAQLRSDTEEMHKQAARSAQLAKESLAKVAVEHERLQKLLHESSKETSCDAAWNEIEQQH